MTSFFPLKKKQIQYEQEIFAFNSNFQLARNFREEILLTNETVEDLLTRISVDLATS
jgi:hypothetical protein